LRVLPRRPHRKEIRVVHHVPLVVYINGERQVVGTAAVHDNGNVDARFTTHEMADRLGFLPPGSISLGPSPEENVESDIRELKRTTAPRYRGNGKNT
jgi:hypothetical protein